MVDNLCRLKKNQSSRELFSSFDEIPQINEGSENQGNFKIILLRQ